MQFPSKVFQWSRLDDVLVVQAGDSEASAAWERKKRGEGGGSVGD